MFYIIIVIVNELKRRGDNYDRRVNRRDGYKKKNKKKDEEEL